MYKFKFFFFYIHFLLFILQQLRLPDALIELFKLLIGVNYALCFLILVIVFKVKVYFKELVILSLMFLFIIVKVFILQSFNVALIYWMLAFLCIVKMNWTKEEILILVNRIAVLYFIVAILLRFTPLNAYFGYENRELENRFLFSINRFLGIEGSPAGPDLFYTLVLLLNIKFYGIKKSFKSLSFIIGVIVIVWTASLSNLLAACLGLGVYILYRIRFITFLVVILTPFISTYLILNFGHSIEVILNVLTTLRANIWLQVVNNMLELNSLEEWFVGQNELHKFIGYNGVDANPHNLTLFAIQFLGVPIFVLVILILMRKILLMPKNYFFYLTMFIFCYSISNAMPFTTRGNPVILYILVFSLIMGNRKTYLKKT